MPSHDKETIQSLLRTRSVPKLGFFTIHWKLKLRVGSHLIPKIAESISLDTVRHSFQVSQLRSCLKAGPLMKDVWPSIRAPEMQSRDAKASDQSTKISYRSNEWLLKSRKGAFQLSLNSAQQVRTSLTIVWGPAPKTPTEARSWLSAVTSARILLTLGRPRLTARREPSSAWPTCRHRIFKLLAWFWNWVIFIFIRRYQRIIFTILLKQGVHDRLFQFSQSEWGFVWFSGRWMLASAWLQFSSILWGAVGLERRPKHVQICDLIRTGSLPYAEQTWSEACALLHLHLGWECDVQVHLAGSASCTYRAVSVGMRKKNCLGEVQLMDSVSSNANHEPNLGAL